MGADADDDELVEQAAFAMFMEGSVPDGDAKKRVREVLRAADAAKRARRAKCG